MYRVTHTFAGSLLVNGATPVSFRQVAPGAANDRAYLQGYRVDYTRLLKARAGQLLFWGRSGTNLYGVSAMATNAGIVVLDITDPAAPVSLTNRLVSGSAGNWSCNIGSVGSINVSGWLDVRNATSRPLRCRYVLFCLWTGEPSADPPPCARSGGGPTTREPSASQ